VNIPNKKFSSLDILPTITIYVFQNYFFFSEEKKYLCLVDYIFFKVQHLFLCIEIICKGDMLHFFFFLDGTS